MPFEDTASFSEARLSAYIYADLSSLFWNAVGHSARAFVNLVMYDEYN